MLGIPRTQRIIPEYSVELDLNRWLEAFLLDRRAQNAAAGTVKFYTKKLTHFASWCEAQQIATVTQVTPDALRRFMLWLSETGHNPGGQHAVYRAVKAFLLWFERELELEGWKNPIRKVKPPRVQLEPLEPADLNIVKKLLDVCERDKQGERDKAVFYTLLDTGARAAELCALTVADVDAVTGQIEVRCGKGRKSRTVFLGKAARRALRSWLNRRGNKPGSLFGLEYDGLRSMVARRSKQAKVAQPTLHAFRRAFALNMVRAGVDLYSLQQLMGHADLQVLRRYVKLLPDDLRNAHARGAPADRL